MSYEGTAEFMYALHDAALLLFYNVQMRETERKRERERGRERERWEALSMSQDTKHKESDCLQL